MNRKKGNKSEDDLLEEAKGYIRLLLKYRPRSRQEIRDKLTSKDYPQGVIDDSMDWAKRKGLIDDEIFAELWIEDRMEHKPKGRSGLYKELLDHGIDKAVARDALDRKFEEVDESQLCRRLARKRLDRYSGEETKAKYRKTVAFLQRRGFRKSLSHKVLKNILFSDD